MSEAKHTPGPWLAAEAVSSRVGLPVVKSGEGGGRLICHVNCSADPIHGKVAGDDAFNREALGNARLIAAAPDLLEALKAIVAADNAFRASMSPEVEKDPVTLACDAARATIAKAEVRS